MARGYRSLVRYVRWRYPLDIAEHILYFLRAAWLAGRKRGLSAGIVATHIEDLFDRRLYLLDLALMDPQIPLAWVRRVLSNAKYVGAFPQILAHFGNVVALAAQGPYEPEFGLLQTLVEKALKRNDTRAVGYLAAIIGHARDTAKDPRAVLRGLERQLGAMLATEGRKTVPRHGVSRYVHSLVLAYAARLITGAPVDSALEELEAGLKDWIAAHGGGEIEISRLRRVPGTVLAAALSIHGITHPRYLLWLRASAAGREREFLQNLLGQGKHEHFDARYTLPLPGGPTTFHVSKYQLLPVLESLEHFPTCFNPALGDRGHPFIFGGEKNGIVPLIIVAERDGKIVGRVSTVWDFNRGKVFVTSVPLGRVGLQHYLDVIEAHAREINAREGGRVFREIWVGAPGGKAFPVAYPGLYDDYAHRGFVLGTGEDRPVIIARKAREI